MNCNGVIGKDCDDCNENCVMKLSENEWKANKKYRLQIMSALHEKQIIEDIINEYYQLKHKLNREGLMVEDFIYINIKDLRKRKKEVESRLRELRTMEFKYKKKLDKEGL